MKKATYYFIVILTLFFFNCKREGKVNEINNVTDLIETLYLNKNNNKFQHTKTIHLLNDSINLKSAYEMTIIIEDYLGNRNYSFKSVDINNIYPIKSNLSVCYKEKDSILVNNLFEKDGDLEWYFKYILENEKDEIFIDFSIDETVSGKMNKEEWINCMNYLSFYLNKLTEIQNVNNKKFRLHFIFKGRCFMQPGPPPK